MVSACHEWHGAMIWHEAQYRTAYKIHAPYLQVKVSEVSAEI